MDRWSELLGSQGTAPHVAPGWAWSRLCPASGLFGANGIQIGPDARLYVAQAFGSQISAIDVDRGACEVIVPQGGPIVGPDDVAFDSHGNLYVTEVMSARVSVRSPSGAVRVLADELPSANGITVYQDRVFIDEHRRGGRLFELYPDGRRAPRLIAADLFGPNALMAGPDGKLYYPLVPLGEVWRVDIETGRQERVATGLQAPPAVKFNHRGELIVPQARTGEIMRIDVQSGAKTRLAQVRPGIDNLAFTADDRLLVSHFIDGGVAEVATDGSSTERRLVPPGFVGPWGLVADTADGLIVGDGLSLAAVPADGEVRRLGGLLDERFPGFIRGLAAGTPGELLITTARGDVVRYDLATRTFTIAAKRVGQLYGITLAADGAAMVTEHADGTLLRVDADGQTTPYCTGLQQPCDVVALENGGFAVSELGTGRVVSIDAQGQVTALVSGLDRPQGLAVAAHTLLILDHGSRSLHAVDLTTRHQHTLATRLPIGATGPMAFPGGLAVGQDGTIYLAADGEGSLLALRRSAGPS